MAEVVELRLERGVPELLQLKRVNLFSDDEVKTIIKKRKAFEYKLQKQEKVKEDYLKYVAYEESLIKLIKVRRKKIGYYHKYKEIENTIANRIAQLFRAVVYRHQGDVKLWLLYIDFCKRMEWKGTVSSLYIRMLQVHNKKESIWVLAAKWEFGNNAHDAARKLLQRGLRHLPESQLLWLEYFRMELMYAEKVLKRRDLLLKPTEFDEEASQSVTITEEETTNDSILSGKVAQLVFEKAISTISEPSFISSFVDVLEDFKSDNFHSLKDIVISSAKPETMDQ
ncbi:U3 small nucleolar RNA-associated protein 6 -like protein [Halotydeus destructor]|nr:U3 small nucleolar RNA-associated protein 6 -like protein [Halotydeus destructor]